MAVGRVRTRLFALGVLAMSTHRAVVVRADDTLNGPVSEAFDFAGVQLAALKENTLVENTMFTDYTNEAGEWRTVKDNGNDVTQTVWTSGMVAGMFWYQYEATGESLWKDYAEDIQIGLEGVEVLDDNDLGFQVLNSFGLGYRLVGTSAFKERVLAGAASLYDFRYQENIGAFWSWENPTKRPDWDRAVNVDMIMNMEIMLWAAVNGGDSAYIDAVETHADTAWEDLVRDDFSTFHVAAYDPDTGELVDQGTYQGWKDETTWSRGQAWAVHGYAMVYRFTNEQRHLDRSIELLGYFDGNLPEDNVPFADYDAPEDADNPEDSSSTAIVASSLFEVFELTGDPIYLEKAQVYLSSLILSPSYFDPTATDGWEALLRKSTAAWGEPSTGSVTGDYFLLETLVRYKTMAPSILLRDEMGVSIADGEHTAVFSGTALDNDVDLTGLAEDVPVIIWFGATLINADSIPVSFEVTGSSLSTTVSIPAPTEGWQAGSNTVSFSVAAGTLSGVDKVEGITLTFDSASSGATDVGVDYLIVGHKLKTSLKTCSDEGGECDAPGSCCTGTCGLGGTCTSSSGEPAPAPVAPTGQPAVTPAPETEGETPTPTPSAPIAPTGSVCASAGGIPGVESPEKYMEIGHVCCLEECGECGGSGCRERTGNANDCCMTNIADEGRDCSVANEAPCFITAGDSALDPSTLASETEAYREIGCFTDKPDPDRVKPNMIGSDSMTVEMCHTHCVGSIYFGLQWGIECWCDDAQGDVDFPFDTHGASAECTMECAGDADQVCGGFWAMSVYENI